MNKKTFRHRFLAMSLLAASAATLIVGCGETQRERRERTLSILNVEADKWDGGPKFETGIVDSYGQPVSAKVEKKKLDFVLELRSNGPDMLPQNRDDIRVTRSKRHGGTTLTKEAANAAEEITTGIGSGLVKGIKKGLAGKKE